MKYVDISSHQGVVNFQSLKGNVDGVIIRAGYGRNNIDSQFRRNISECNRLGIPCGVYWFSYAYTETMAAKEAEYMLSAISDYVVELPVAFDYEYDSVRYGQKQGVTISADLVRRMTNAFCQKVEQNKYYCMLYANKDYINKYFGDLTNKYDLWYAQYPAAPNPDKPPRSCGIWQWTSKGTVPGIHGYVDVNAVYKDYVSIIKKAKLNHLPITDNIPTVNPQVEPTTPVNETVVPWYTNVMQWGKENGICDGTRPEDTATRAEVVQMLYNFNQKFLK